MKNRHGKMACAYGFPALALSGLAEYSEQYRTNSDGEGLISPFMNILLLPYRWLESLLVNPAPAVEPTMSPLTIFYVFEQEAVIGTLTLALFLSALALRQTVLGARQNEFSIWYANGGAASIHAVLFIHAGLGAAVSIATIWIVEKSRARSGEAGAETAHTEKG